MKKNKKGFTMVEMLAAIVILGILSSIAIVSVTVLRKNQIKKYNDTQYNIFLETGKNFFKDNIGFLPKEPFKSEYVTLKELEEAKYITEDFVDYYGNKYNANSKITVINLTNGKYKYNAFLIDSNGNETQTPKANINSDIEYYKKLDNNNYSKLSINTSKNRYYANKEPKIKFSISSDINLEAYLYYIYKDGNLIKTSEFKQLNSVRNKTISISLNNNDYSDATYLVKVVIYDANGYKYTIKSDKLTFDRIAPTNPLIQNPYDNQWKNISYSITGTSSDNVSGIEKWQYTYSLDSEYNDYRNSSKQSFTIDFNNEINKKIYIRTCDYAGNCSDKSSSTIKIDKTPPTKPVFTDKAYVDKWINENYQIGIKSTDDLSGVKAFKYKYTSNTQSGDNTSYGAFSQATNRITKSNTTYSQTPNAFTKERNSGISIIACDYAGNCSNDKLKESGTLKGTIMIDKQNPDCIVTGGTTTWINSNSKPNKTEVKATCKDEKNKSINADSGCITSSFSKEYSTDINTSKAGAKGENNPGVVKDAAGNETTCDYVTVQIDKTPPTITSLTNPTSINGDLMNVNWTNQNIQLTGTAEDSGSGIAYWYWGWDNNSGGIDYYRYDSAEYNSYEKTRFTTSPYTEERNNQTTYIRACDKAGNCSSPTKTKIKIDKTDPKCGDWIGENSTWTWKYQEADVKCIDSLSQCRKEIYYVDSWSQDNTEIETVNLSQEIYDNAGNHKTCSYNNFKVYLDRIPPTCEMSFPGTDGYAANTNANSWNYYYIKCTSSDCTDTTGYVTENQQTIGVTDKAGNTCSGKVNLFTTTLHYYVGGATGLGILPVPNYPNLNSLGGAYRETVVQHMWYGNIMRKSDTTAYKLNIDYKGTRYYGTTSHGGYWTRVPSNWNQVNTVWEYTEMNIGNYYSDLYACYVEDNDKFPRICANGYNAIG